tara:strand:- start:21 stop:227 length:207 start_codon:yes stop_codon:yes gene_type:complete
MMVQTKNEKTRYNIFMQLTDNDMEYDEYNMLCVSTNTIKPNKNYSYRFSITNYDENHVVVPRINPCIL